MRRLGFLLATVLVASSVSGCSPVSTSSPGATADARPTMGPYPAGVTVSQGDYELTAQPASVLGTPSVSIGERNGWGPSTSSHVAREGYRFIDVTIAVKAPRGGSPSTNSVTASATVNADGQSTAPDAGLSWSQMAAKPLEWTETVEFELPTETKSAVLVLPMKAFGPDSISFRLW